MRRSCPIFQADQGNNRIRRLWANGSISTLYTGFSGPASVASDGAGGYIMADAGWHQVLQVSAANVMSVVSAG